MVRDSKELAFSVNSLHLEGRDTISVSDFEKIAVSAIEPENTIDGKVLGVEACEKASYNGRFVSLFLQKAKKFPFSKHVYDASDAKNITVKDNPREPDELEPDDDIFVLIDCEKQRIYLSNQHVRKEMERWLTKRLGSPVSITALIDQGDFAERVESLKEISLSIEPEVFNPGSSSTLSKILNHDSYGLGEGLARAELRLKYKQLRLSDKVKKGLGKFIEDKERFKKIMVTGRTSDGLDGFLNMNEVVYKTTLHPLKDGTTGRFVPEDVFNSLVGHIMTSEVTWEK